MLSIIELFSDADDAFFERIMTNSEHVLQPFLPCLLYTSDAADE